MLPCGLGKTPPAFPQNLPVVSSSLVHSWRSVQQGADDVTEVASFPIGLPGLGATLVPSEPRSVGAVCVRWLLPSP